MDTYRLTIDGRAVPLRGPAGTERSVGLEQISISYDAARQLDFRELGDPTVFAFSLGQEVRLEVNGIEVFAGRINERAAGPRYRAEDAKARAKMIDLFDDETNRAEIQLPRMPANEMLDILFDKHATQLANEGLSATRTNVPTGEVAGHSFSGSLLDAVKFVLGQLPGWEVLVDETEWRFIDTASSPTFTLALDARHTGGLGGIRISDEGRYTAVRLLGSEVSSITKKEATAQPAWNQALESNWTKNDAKSSSTPTGARSDQAAVFRRWSVPPSTASQVVLSGQTSENGETVPLKPFLGVLRSDVLGGTPEDRYVRKRVADLSQLGDGIIVSEDPLLVVPNQDRVNFHNPNQPGKSKRAPDVRFVFYGKTTLAAPGIRVPATGFEGTAFDVINIRRDRVVRVDENGLVNEEFAQRILDSLKNLLVEGGVDVLGDVPPELWGLDRRVNITSSKVVTGMEAINAPVRSLAYDFRNQRASLDLSTPRGGDFA